jgi:hypothetical protein
MDLSNVGGKQFQGATIIFCIAAAFQLIVCLASKLVFSEEDSWVNKRGGWR